MKLKLPMIADPISNEPLLEVPSLKLIPSAHSLSFSIHEETPAAVSNRILYFGISPLAIFSLKELDALITAVTSR
jgi:hypothetical protein